MQFVNGWPAPNVRGTRPFLSRASAAASAAAGELKRIRMKFTWLGYGLQPSALRSAVRRSRCSEMRATLAAASSGRLNDAVASAAETVETEAGARNDMIGARISGRATAKPTRAPARAWALLSVLMTTRRGYRSRNGRSELPVNSM